MRVRPCPGMRVLDPETRRPIPAEGMDVADNAYWGQRLNHGDVELVATEPAPAAAPEPPAPEEHV